jgi:hypothetical protein
LTEVHWIYLRNTSLVTDFQSLWKTHHQNPIYDSGDEGIWNLSKKLANSKYVWGINSAGGLSNECEAIHNEYWLELGDDETRQDDNPEAGTGSEMIYAGQ